MLWGVYTRHTWFVMVSGLPHWISRAIPRFVHDLKGSQSPINCWSPSAHKGDTCVFARDHPSTTCCRPQLFTEHASLGVRDQVYEVTDACKHISLSLPLSCLNSSSTAKSTISSIMAYLLHESYPERCLLRNHLFLHSLQGAVGAVCTQPNSLSQGCSYCGL